MSPHFVFGLFQAAVRPFHLQHCPDDPSINKLAKGSPLQRILNVHRYLQRNLKENGPLLSVEECRNSSVAPYPGGLGVLAFRHM